jgi:prolyl oligopeptidase
MRYPILLLISLVTIVATAKNPKKQKSTITYPVSQKINHTDTYFGTTVEDPYQWLEDDTSAQTAAWVEAQNKITFNYLDKIPYRNEIKERYKELYDYAKIDNPMMAGDYLFFEKKEGLQNQPVIYIQKGLQGNPSVFINPNELDSKGLSAVSITGISKDNKYVNVSIHKAGSDWSEMYIYDIATKTKLSDKLEWLKNGGADWDDNGFYYSRYPKPEEGKELSAKNEYNSVYYHKLGASQDQDVLIYRDNEDPLTYNSVYLSEGGQYAFLYKFKGTYGNELYYKKTNEQGWNFKPLFTGYKNTYYLIDVINDKFLILTDDGASNKQLVAIDPENPDAKNWKKIIAEDKNALLESVNTTGGKLFTKYLQNATNKLFVIDIDGKNKKEIALPGTGEIDIFSGKKSDRMIQYTYTSFNYPKSIFTYDLNTGYSNLFLKPTLKFNPEDFESKQIWYKSKDGTKVSMFIVHKKGLVLNGKNPTYLYGYGGFNINKTPVFSASNIILLENGGVFAMPNLRGGGEYGDDWHRAGMLMKKQNVFDDFIAAAQYLIKQKYTSKEKLAIAGGSNGGLLVGACMTQKPDLFKVAFPAVGVMDMLKFHQFTIGHAWIVEYGSSEQSKEMFEYLKGYSPYHNIQPNTKYPATMVTTADHDDRVVPAHSFKFAARLQEYNVSPNPMLIRIGVNAGHGAGKPTSKIIEEEADKWSFFFWNIGYKTLK